MFATLFTTEEKVKFLALVYACAKCDGTYTEDEEELVNSYKRELGIESIDESAPLDTLIDYFGEKPPQIRKIVFFEIYGMVMSDDKIAKEEMAIMGMMKERFAMDDETYNRIIDAANQLQEAYDLIYHVLF